MTWMWILLKEEDRGRSQWLYYRCLSTAPLCCPPQVSVDGQTPSRHLQWALTTAHSRMGSFSRSRSSQSSPSWSFPGQAYMSPVFINDKLILGNFLVIKYFLQIFFTHRFLGFHTVISVDILLFPLFTLRFLRRLFYISVNSASNLLHKSFQMSFSCSLTSCNPLNNLSNVLCSSSISILQLKKRL